MKPGRTNTRTMILVVAALAALTAIVYAPTGSFAFVNWDDPSDIVDNPFLTNGLTAKALWWAITTTREPYWHPITWISHLADVSLFGMNAGAHHLVSAAIHGLAAVMAFVALVRLTNDKWPSAFVAAMFAVHPLHVESVAWVTERSDVLCGFFWFAAIWLYVRHLEKPALGRFCLVAGAVVLALASKPTAVTLPLALFLVWRFKTRGRVEHPRAFRQRIAELLVLGLASAAVGVATIAVQTRIGAVAPLSALPAGARIGNAAVNYILYIVKAVWPARLAAFYPQAHWPAAAIAAAAAILLAITAALWRLRSTRPLAFFGWAWFVLTLLPVIGLLQSGEQAIADRFMYVPIVGLFIIAGWWPAARHRRAALAAAVALVAGSAIAARAQVATWSDSVTLWEHALAVTTDNHVAREKLADAYRDAGRPADALANYERAARLVPPGSPLASAVIENSLGLVRLRLGHPVEAREAFEDAVRLNPSFAEAHNNLGNALAAEGRPDAARSHYQRALQLDPRMVEALIGLGSVMLNAGEGAAAERVFNDALALDPGLAEAHNGLGSALALQGSYQRARREYEEALRLKPALETARRNLALLDRVR